MDKSFLTNGIPIGDSQLIASVVPKKKEEKSDPFSEPDQDFSKLLDKEQSKVDEGHYNRGNEFIDGKNETESKDKKTFDAKDAAIQDKVQKEVQEHIRQQLEKMSPMLNYIYNLMYKNPDSLSLLEKHAVGIDIQEMKKYEAEFGEFKKLLSDRGLKLSDLKLEDFAKLMQRDSKSQITSYLDYIVRERAIDAEKKAAELLNQDEGKDKANQLQSTSEVKQDASHMPDSSLVKKDDELQKQKNADEAQKRQDVVDQIIKQIAIRNVNEKTELVMQLNPEYLGELKMKLSYEDGRTSAKFETTSQEVRQIIEGSLSELRDMMTEKGVKLDSASVTLVESV